MIKQYNRTEAVKYAEKWWNERNPEYYDFSNQGGDCTNFISQCLKSGGMNQNYKPTFGWYYKDSYNRAPAWSGVPYLFNFLTRQEKSAGPAAKIVGIEDIEIGDIIQLSFDGIEFSHSLIVTDITKDFPDQSGILVATHTYDSFNKPLSEYFYEDIRFLHIMGSY